MRYDIDPFVEVTKITDGVYHLVSPGWSPSCMYVVEGHTRALLIDTGYGIGNMKGLVEKITKLPYDVVNTHFHGDHTLGNYQFSDVYIHVDDLALCRKNADHEIRGKFITLPQNMDVPFTISDYVPLADYNLVPIRAGHMFDLGGGYELEVIEVPGHTFGCICLLDRKRRMLFTGDALVFTPTFIFKMDKGKERQATVTIYLDALKKLLLRSSEIDGLYPGHNKLNLSPDMIQEMIICCEEIIKDPQVGMDFDYGNKYTKVHKYGRASIAYSNDRI